MSSPKEYHQKKFRTNDVSALKNTLKTPPQTIFKRGGGFKTPHAIGFLRTPPPCANLRKPQFSSYPEHTEHPISLRPLLCIHTHGAAPDGYPYTTHKELGGVIRMLCSICNDT